MRAIILLGKFIWEISACHKHGQATISRHWNWNLRREQKVGGTEGCPRVGEEGQGIQKARPGAGGPDGPQQHARRVVGKKAYMWSCRGPHTLTAG